MSHAHLTLVILLPYRLLLLPYVVQVERLEDDLRLARQALTAANEQNVSIVQMCTADRHRVLAVCVVNWPSNQPRVGAIPSCLLASIPSSRQTTAAYSQASSVSGHCHLPRNAWRRSATGWSSSWAARAPTCSRRRSCWECASECCRPTRESSLAVHERNCVVQGTSLLAQECCKYCHQCRHWRCHPDISAAQASIWVRAIGRRHCRQAARKRLGR